MKGRELLSSFLPGLVREKGWEKQIDLHSIFLDWQELVGEVADYATPQKIVKNVLLIQVENSARIQQLQYQKSELLEILNGHLRLSRVRDVKFVLAPLPPPQQKEEQGVRFVPPPPQEQRVFEQQIGTIGDEKIQESLMRLWYLDHACKRDKK